MYCRWAVKSALAKYREGEGGRWEDGWRTYNVGGNGQEVHQEYEDKQEPRPVPYGVDA